MEANKHAVQSRIHTQIAVISVDELKEIIREILTTSFSPINKTNPKAEKQWITQSEARELLPYRSKTSWQNLRDTGKISFSQSGRKILYERSSIIKFIEKNRML